jgi:hypothetical protein
MVAPDPFVRTGLKIGRPERRSVFFFRRALWHQAQYLWACFLMRALLHISAFARVVDFSEAPAGRREVFYRPTAGQKEIPAAARAYK